MIYERKSREKLPVLAICYDFDKTLTPDDMQAQGYIQNVGFSVEDFWKESNELAVSNDMDQNLAYMLKMIEESEGKFAVNKKTLMDYGAKVTLFSGVKEWFNRIKEYGKEKGVIVEHYIISSGLKEMIEGTKVAQEGAFEKIYASSFYFNSKGAAVWPAQVVNYTNKTQFLFRIEKGTLDVNDPAVNDYFPPEEIRVPFRNMIYIGDSDTDVPCMKLVNSYGGHAIGVYNAETKDKTKVHKMMRDGRIKYYVPADYCENSELDCLVKLIIDRTAFNEMLETKFYEYKNETLEADSKSDCEERKRKEAILGLESSRSFAQTHSVIKTLNSFSHWKKDEIEMLCDIAIRNGQVRCIITDSDVRLFYKSILESTKKLGTHAQQIKKIIESNDKG